MNRRQFFQNSALIAAALPPLTYHHGADAQVTLLKTFENSHLAVKIYSNSAIEIEDRVNGRNWKTGPVAIQDKSVVEVGQVWLTTTRDQTVQYPGRIHGSYLGEDDVVMGVYGCSMFGRWSAPRASVRRLSGEAGTYLKG